MGCICVCLSNEAMHDCTASALRLVAAPATAAECTHCIFYISEPTHQQPGHSPLHIGAARGGHLDRAPPAPARAGIFVQVPVTLSAAQVRGRTQQCACSSALPFGCCHCH